MGNDENYLSSSSNLLDNQLFKENANNSNMSHLRRPKISDVFESQDNESSDDSKNNSQDDDDNDDNNKDEIPSQRSTLGTFMRDLLSKEITIKFDIPDFVNQNNSLPMYNIRDKRNNYPSIRNTINNSNDKRNNIHDFNKAKLRSEFFERPKFSGLSFIPYNDGLRTNTASCNAYYNYI